MLKEGISGIRGYEAELSSGLITKYIKAFFKLVNPKKVVVGRDSRKSGERIVENINKALRSFGVTVLDIGINPTPTVQVTTEKMGYDAGIIVTASHNPLPWNGLKFVDASGTFFNFLVAKYPTATRIKETATAVIKVLVIGIPPH